MVQKKKKCTFILKGIDINAVNLKYQFKLISNIGRSHNSSSSVFITKIKDLPAVHNPELSVFSFLDQSKQKHKCVITMYNLVNEETIPLKTHIKCFWCKHNFNTTPIGCPIKFIPSKITKNYYSEITKDYYQITDMISSTTKKTIDNITEKHDSKFKILQNYNEFFIVDGIFCSFNCCIAFIHENKHKSLYDMSEYFLYNFYNKTFGKNIKKILKAPHWRLLKDFGGTLSIDDFRKSFINCEYTDHQDFIYNIPQCKMTGRLFEKKIKF